MSVTFTKNHDGTMEWKSAKMKEVFDDFDAKVDTRIITGTAGNSRTEAITIKPGESTNTIEIIGVNDTIEIDHKNRKNCDILYLEVRSDEDIKDEEILIAHSIITSRLIKLGFEIETKPHFKKKWSAGFQHGVTYCQD